MFSLNPEHTPTIVVTTTTHLSLFPLFTKAALHSIFALSKQISMVHPFPQRKIRVLIVEDSAIVADKFMELLSTHNDIDVVGVAHNISFATQMITLQKPDAVMIDIHLETDAPTANGITLLAMLQIQHPNLKKIMLTNLVEDMYRDKCMELGASHFLDKSDDFEKVLEAIRTINILKPAH